MLGSQTTRELEMPLDHVMVGGFLTVPPGATGVVLFAHGSGSGRHSPRNQQVAAVLNEAGLGTLLLDLLSPEEEEYDCLTGLLRFDIQLLSERLGVATKWLRESPLGGRCNIGYFGGSTGAAAALMAAARHPQVVKAVVSRGGRPDLAGKALHAVKAPTLLIVGSLDETVLQLNREALIELRCQKELKIVPGATHLFNEPGCLELVARLAAEWFSRYL